MYFLTLTIHAVGIIAPFLGLLIQDEEPSKDLLIPVVKALVNMDLKTAEMTWDRLVIISLQDQDFQSNIIKNETAYGTLLTQLIKLTYQSITPSEALRSMYTFIHRVLPQDLRSAGYLKLLQKVNETNQVFSNSSREIFTLIKLVLEDTTKSNGKETIPLIKFLDSFPPIFKNLLLGHSILLRNRKFSGYLYVNSANQLLTWQKTSLTNKVQATFRFTHDFNSVDQDEDSLDRFIKGDSFFLEILNFHLFNSISGQRIDLLVVNSTETKVGDNLAKKPENKLVLNCNSWWIEVAHETAIRLHCFEKGLEKLRPSFLTALDPKYSVDPSRAQVTLINSDYNEPEGDSVWDVIYA